jgi:uncharacterized membrane protein HdeD (DUF308 family)
MKYVKPLRLKIMMGMFFGAGIVGIIVGLSIAPPQGKVMITFMGVINLALGAFFGWIFLNQKPELSNDKRKKKSNDN